MWLIGDDAVVDRMGVSVRDEWGGDWVGVDDSGDGDGDVWD